MNPISTEPVKKWLERGVTHLTFSFLFTFFGIEVAVSGAAAWAASAIQKTFAGPSLPTHFYVVLGLLVFCAITLFAILIWIVQKSVTTISAPQVPSPISKLTIHSAFYGNTSENEVPVLAKLNSLPRDAFAIYVHNNSVDAEPSSNIGPKKQLRVRYSYGNDTVFETSREEGEWMALPDPTNRKRIIK